MTITRSCTFMMTMTTMMTCREVDSQSCAAFPPAGRPLVVVWEPKGMAVSPTLAIDARWRETSSSL